MTGIMLLWLAVATPIVVVGIAFLILYFKKE
jgi:hypothetical protein